MLIIPEGKDLYSAMPTEMVIGEHNCGRTGIHFSESEVVSFNGFDSTSFLFNFCNFLALAEEICNKYTS